MTGALVFFITGDDDVPSEEARVAIHPKVLFEVVNGPVASKKWAEDKQP